MTKNHIFTCFSAATLLLHPQLSAQEVKLSSVELSDSPLSKQGTVFHLPEISKSTAIPADKDSLFVNQDIFTLSPRRASTKSIDFSLDTSILEKISAYRSATRVKAKVSSTQASEISNGLAEISAAYKKPAEKSELADCKVIATSVKHRVIMDKDSVLEIVESEIAANPGCSCEIVKAAIKYSEADIPLTADITEVAIITSPDNMRMISQCAIATKPDALTAIQAVLAKLDPLKGDTDSSKSSKSAKSGKDGVAATITPPNKPPNPLDRPYNPPPQPPPPPPENVTEVNP